MIRKANIDDIDIITKYNCKMALETENINLNYDMVYEGVKNAILHNKSRYYLFEKNSHVVGQIMITREWSDWRNCFFWWIQSVYVHEEFRKQGIFKRLYQYIEKEADENNNICGLRLYVEKNNDRAQKIYNKLGMDKTNYFLYEKLI